MNKNIFWTLNVCSLKILLFIFLLVSWWIYSGWELQLCYMDISWFNLLQLIFQINRRMEFVFASHSFDVWENWTLEGSLDECRLVNCRNSSVRPLFSYIKQSELQVMEYKWYIWLNMSRIFLNEFFLMICFLYSWSFFRRHSSITLVMNPHFCDVIDF